MADGQVRLWRFDGRGLRISGGADPGWTPPVPHAPGLVPTPAGSVWLEPVPPLDGFWLELAGIPPERCATVARRLRPVLSALLAAERQTALVTEELTSRYEEIDLLYTISEILGSTLRVEEAARTILREVATVVGARRGSIMVLDEPAGGLRVVASRGQGNEGERVVPMDDPISVAARTFRERRIIEHDPGRNSGAMIAPQGARGYLGEGFLSVPINYAAPGSAVRCIGVINLTDRLGGDAFTSGNRKLVAAVANQIGAAIENARLVVQDLRQQRLQRELELAHDLQLKLLPSPHVLQGDAQVAARCLPVDSVGGDFYTFTRLGGGRVGVMLGDVASHGFSAALVMALVMAAAGIHAGAAATPDEALSALLDSLGEELTRTEMYFSVFYGVLDPKGGRMAYANAGHPYAFRLPRVGDPERLLTTAPPLGLAEAGGIRLEEVAWDVGGDLLCLWTDGLVDARSGEGEAFGERRLLELLAARRHAAPETIVQEVLAEADAFAPEPADDRTLLVLRF